MKAFVRELVKPLNPLKFRELSDKPWWEAVWYFSKVLLVAVVIMSIILAPEIFRLSSYFDTQLAKFDALSVRGNLSVTEPVYFPDRKPQLVIDTTGLYSHLGSERFLITDEGLYYRWFNQERAITKDEFAALLENKEKTSKLLTAAAVFLIPSALFFLYAFLWTKYSLTILLFGTIFYFLLDLTHYRLPWRQVMNIAGYASALMILVEVISLGINTDYLVTLVQIIGVNIYLVPLLLYIVLMIVATTMVHVKKPKHDTDL